MWVELKKIWMNNPKGTRINLNETVGTRLIGCGTAEVCSIPEKNPKKTIYFPEKKIDQGEVDIVNSINAMNKKGLLEFIKENDLKVDLNIITIYPDKKYPNDKNRARHITSPKLLSNLKTEVAMAAVKSNLRFEDEEEKKEDIVVPRKPNLGKNKMMSSSPVSK